jgi:hypothetical protein
MMLDFRQGVGTVSTKVSGGIPNCSIAYRYLGELIRQGFCIDRVFLILSESGDSPTGAIYGHVWVLIDEDVCEKLR